jgi:hypothetical protein
MKKHLICALALSGLTVACNKQTYSLPGEEQAYSQSVTYNNKVDVVLMVDNSSSMDTYQNKLADQVPGMITALNKLGMDYRIAVVTTDMRAGGNGGVFVGSPKVLSVNSPNLATLLTGRVRQGTGGSDLERGLQSLETALNTETGFIRNDAMLAVIALSNEDDYSSGTSAQFKQYFDQLKPKFTGFNGATQAWMINFIGVPNLQSSCTTALDGIYKEPGLKWIDLANMSGGLVQPICDTTLSLAVDNIRKRIVEVLTDFHLGRKAKIESIIVKVNGVAVPQSTVNGWEYIDNGYLVRFHGTAVPGADAQISITFDPAEAM